MTRIEGDWIAAVNQASHVRGSIHDEDRAKELGFAHAVVGAGMHIPLVTRGAVELFGQDWYERGFLKARFGVPVHAGDEIRLVFEDTEPAQYDERLLSLWIEKRDGTKPLSGFLGLLASADVRVAPWERAGERLASTDGTYDPLPSDPMGTEFPARTMRFEAAESLPALRVVRDTCNWYEASSPWGEAILPTYRFVKIPRLSSDLHPAPDAAVDMQSSMNALFQVAHTGPVRCGVDYSVQATLVEKGFSGRTAFRTSEATIREGPRPVARIRQMLRWVPQRARLKSA